MESGDQQLHIVTPTIQSMPLTKIAGFDVYLKLENLQIPGSFKIRGIGNLIKKVLFSALLSANTLFITSLFKSALKNSLKIYCLIS